MQIQLVFLPSQVQAPMPQDPPVQPVRQVDVPVELLRYHERTHLLPALISGSSNSQRSVTCCR